MNNIDTISNNLTNLRGEQSRRGPLIRGNV